METQTKRYVASVNIVVEATDADAVNLILEEALASIKEYHVVDIFGEDGDDDAE